MRLLEPSPDYVREILGDAKHDKDDRYFGADPALRLVFDQWPANLDPYHVLVKVVVLDRLYSTHVFKVYLVRNHILNLQIDKRLAAGDPTLVNELADVRLDGKRRWLISFASKYCAWHRPDSFQIFDSSVERILREYNEMYPFADFGRFDLRDYMTFARVLNQFRSRFGLAGFSRKEIDKFLWIEAKTMT